MGIEKLKELQRAKIYDDFLRKEKECVFINPMQGKLLWQSMMQNFVKFGRFALELIFNDKKPMEWFENALHPKLRRQLAIFPTNHIGNYITDMSKV